jgi:hypothetical protein
MYYAADSWRILLFSEFGLASTLTWLVRSKLTSPTLTSNSRKTYKVLYFFINIYSRRNVFSIFLNFWYDLKKWSFYILFDRSLAVAPRFIAFLLKGTVARDFWPRFFSWINPIWAPDSCSKIFFFYFEFAEKFEFDGGSAGYHTPQNKKPFSR